MGGCFHREMGDTLARQHIQSLMQGHRIRRCQRAIRNAIRAHDSNRAKAGCLFAAGFKNLAREISNRGFARRTRYRNTCFRLTRVKLCGRHRENMTNIDCRNCCSARYKICFAFVHNCNCTCLYSVYDEGRTIVFDATHRKKDEALPNKAAIRREACYLLRALLSWDRWEQVTKLHFVPHAPSFTMVGNGATGGSNRFGISRNGAVRSIMAPVTGPAFHPAV